MSEAIKQDLEQVTQKDESRGASWIDLGVEPAAAQRLGAATAAAAESFAPTVVLSWAGADEVVLAHVVAQALGVPRTVVDLDLGLLSIDRELPAASAVLLVGTEFDANRPIASVDTLLSGAGHRLLAAITLSSASAIATGDSQVPVISLA